MYSFQVTNDGERQVEAGEEVCHKLNVSAAEIVDALEILRKAAAGDYKTFFATMDAAKPAVDTIEAAGLGDEYDDLIGAVADKAFEMDTLEYGA